jgi:hypothetical protein
LIKPIRTTICLKCCQLQSSKRKCSSWFGHNWHTFDSKSEAERYTILKGRECLKLIRWLEIQPVFQLKDCTYRPDFFYFDTQLKKWVVEDWKNGHFSDTFKKKWEQMQSMKCYKHYIFIISTERLQ